MAYLKFLICDDEQNIRNGLKCIIDWEKCGFTFCGEASNGKDAVTQIIDLQPDLVLLDIRMPGLSGLEVVQQVNEYYASKNLVLPYIIILSGFSEFDYAKTAINLGVKSYLVKPVDEEDLEKAVMTASAEIYERRHLLQSSQKADLVEFKELMHKILDTPYLPTEQELSANDFFLNSEDAEFQCISFCLDYAQGLDRQDFEKTIQNYFSFFMNDIIFSENTITVILRTSNESAVLNCIDRASKLSPKRTFICVGQKLTGINGLKESYSQIQEYQKYLFYIYDKPCVCREVLDKQSEGFSQNELSKIIDSFVFCIETYDKKKLSDTTDKLTELFYSILTPEEEVKKNIIYTLIELRNRLVAKYPEREISEGLSFDVVPEILNKKTYEDCIYYVKNVLNKFIENFNFNTADSVIIKVIAYIKTNYASDLKLEALGDLFNCNSAYLGKKFKKYTGVQFNTYLDDLRIEVAKEKLTNTDLKIYQISKLVGYTNTDYFFMKFKKKTGLTPKEFQKKVLNEKENK